MNRAGLLFATFWTDAKLRADVDTLMRCGCVQRAAIAHGADHPSGWFRFLAREYPAHADAFARRACLFVAVHLAESVPS